MITIREYADIIEEQLNENAHAKAFHFQFKVWADIGDFQEAFRNQTDTKLINCILRETTGDYTPIKVAKTKFTSLVFELAVNQYDVDNVKIVLTDWSQYQLGVAYRTDDNTYIVTPAAIGTGTAVNTCDLGSTVPLTMAIELQETALGLISNETKWTMASGDITETEIDVLRAIIVSQRTQQSQTYMNDDETVSTNQMATISVQLTIPVVKNSICKKLYNDILRNKKDELYTIQLDDGWSDGFFAGEEVGGVVYPAENIFILSSGEIIQESTKVVAIQCTFLKSDSRLTNNQ